MVTHPVLRGSLERRDKVTVIENHRRLGLSLKIHEGADTEKVNNYEVLDVVTTSNTS